MPDTNPAASGPATSEFKLTAVAVVIGAILEGVVGVLHSLQDAGMSAPWIPAVLAIIGVVLQVATLLGYQKSRTLVKASLIAADAPFKPPSP